MRNFRNLSRLINGTAEQKLLLPRNGTTMIFLAWTRRLYKVLSADASPAAIAFGISIGLALGCVPLWSGVGAILLLSMLIFRVQISSAMLSAALAKLLIALGFGTVFLPVGEMVLETEPLRPFWTTVLNLPVVAWLDLDSIAVTGGLLVGLLAAILVFWPVRQSIVSYRRWVHTKLAQSRFFQTITNFWFIKALRFIFIGGEAIT
jgi:uncharacterized protein (TIGR03546 family)